VPQLPDSTLGVSRGEGETIVLHRLPSTGPQSFITVNGTAFPEGQLTWTVPYKSGETAITISFPDPLAGIINVNLGIGSASLSWRSAQASTPLSLAKSVQLAEGDLLTMGGGSDDDIAVFGLPPGFFELALNSEKQLVVTLSSSGAKAVEGGENFFTDQPLSREFLIYKEGRALKEFEVWKLGKDSSPTGGRLRFTLNPQSFQTKTDQPTPLEVSGDSPLQPVTSNPRVAQIEWVGNPATIWELPNRKITIPMLPDRPVSLFTRRNWAQAAYPLKRVSPYPSLISSSLFTGLQNKDFNSLSLLQTDPGIQIIRHDSPAGGTDRDLKDGHLMPDTDITFLQLSASSAGTVTTPFERSLDDIVRLATRKKFSRFALRSDPATPEKRSLEIQLTEPEIQSIPMGEIKEGKKIAESQDRRISFGLNEVTGFSAEPYQVRFRSLSDWFRNVNAQVVLGWEIETQDDYRHQKIDFEEPFYVGERDRLHLKITKQTIPTKTLTWLAVGALLSTFVVLKHRQSLPWNALMFGVSFLLCSRLLFSQAAMVNYPYSFEASQTAVLAIVLVPLALVALAILLPFFLPGRLDQKLLYWERGASFRNLAATAFIFLIGRLLFLALGYKESIDLGVGRFSLSIISVPAHIIIFSLGCTRLFWERKRIGDYDFPLIGRFLAFSAAIFLSQFATSVIVSDVGLLLYLIPQALIVALIGFSILAESLAGLRQLHRDKMEIASQATIAILMMMPMVVTVWTFSSPKSLFSAPVLSRIIADKDDIATGSTELRLLQFINEDYLINLGTDTAERIAQDHKIMANYAKRGIWGEGYLQVNVIPAKRTTSLNDNVSAVYLFAQFGVLGAIAVVFAYLCILTCGTASILRQGGPFGWLILTSSLTFSLASVYMMAANYGLLPFTGRNMFLLGLNSRSDIIESMALIALMCLALVVFEYREKSQILTEKVEEAFFS
jgi:hypothetical protein